MCQRIFSVSFLSWDAKFLTSPEAVAVSANTMRATLSIQKHDRPHTRKESHAERALKIKKGCQQKMENSIYLCRARQRFVVTELSLMFCKNEYVQGSLLPQ